MSHSCPTRRASDLVSSPAVARIRAGAGCQDHRGDHHHHNRPDARLWRDLRRISAADPDRFRPVDRLRSLLILPQLLQLRRGSAGGMNRSEEHTSELQSLMRISYAVFCLKKKNKHSYTTQLISNIIHIE